MHPPPRVHILVNEEHRNVVPEARERRIVVEGSLDDRNAKLCSNRQHNRAGVVTQVTSRPTNECERGHGVSRTAPQHATSEPGLLLVATLVTRLAQQLAVLLLGHPLAALLDDGTHPNLTFVVDDQDVSGHRRTPTSQDSVPLTTPSRQGIRGHPMIVPIAPPSDTQPHASAPDAQAPTLSPRHASASHPMPSTHSKPPPTGGETHTLGGCGRYPA